MKQMKLRGYVLVFLITVFFTTLLFSAWAGEKKEEKKSPSLKKSFKEFYPTLDKKMKAKLDKKVTLIFNNGRFDQVIMQFSKQVGVNIMPVGVSDRVDIIEQGSRGKKALETLDIKYEFKWLLDDGCIYIFPKDYNEKDLEKLDRFFDELDDYMKRKLSQPVTVIFSQGKADKIFKIMEKKTGIKIIAKDIESRIDIIAVKEPAADVLKSLAINYRLELKQDGECIVASPMKIEVKEKDPKEKKRRP